MPTRFGLVLSFQDMMVFVFYNALIYSSIPGRLQPTYHFFPKKISSSSLDASAADGFDGVPPPQPVK